MTHSALARMYESMKNQGLEREHWKAAAAIIESTAGGLQDKSLRKTFINATPVREIIEHASRFRGNNEQSTFDPQRVSE